MTDDSNPIVLFGEIGPETYRYSQIYQPSNDQYIASEDLKAVKDPNTGVLKVYYTRSISSDGKVVEFTPVADVTEGVSTPKANSWYETNYGHEDQTGKYVPSVNSIVVVDQDTDAYPERTLLLVESVDATTHESTLVPINTTQDTETSARALDYGNDRFMLYFETKTNSDNTTLTTLVPDRKLMLYGQRYYMYRLTRVNASGLTEVISTPSYLLPGSTDALVPYISATAQIYTLTSSNYGDYAGRTFDTLVGGGLRRCTVPAKPETGGTEKLVQTFDEVYVTGKAYYRVETPGATPSLLVAGTNYTIGHTVGKLIISGTETDVDVSTIQQYASVAFGTGVTGWLSSSDGSTTSTTAHVFYPAPCYLKSSLTPPVTEETVTMEIFELSTTAATARMVMSVKLIAKLSNSLDVASSSTKVITNFDVDLPDNSSSETDVWYVKKGDSVADWVSEFNPTITFSDGSQQIVKVNNTTMFVYGLDAVNTANVDKEFNILFKYFYNNANVYQTNAAHEKSFFTKYKKIKVVNEAAITIRKVSIIPVFNHDSGKYTFKYAVYESDCATAPEFVDDLGATLFSADESSDASASISSTNVVTIKNAKYMDAAGNIRDSSTPGSLLNYIQHAVIAMYVKADGYTNAIYTQDLAFRLQDWEIDSTPAKWLIGDDTSAYDIRLIPYGNTTTDKRPQLEYNPGTTAEPNDKPFRVGTQFSTVADFLKSFYTNGIKKSANVTSVNNTNATTSDDPEPVTPTHFRVRTFFTTTSYSGYLMTKTSGEDSSVAIRGIRYYNESGVEQTVNIGDSVAGYKVKRQEELTYFTVDSGVYTEVPSEELPEVDAYLTDDQRLAWVVNYVDDIVSDPISIGSDLDNQRFSDSFKFNAVPPATLTYDSTGTTVESSTPGGVIPTVFGAKFNSQCMGLVVVEFMTNNNNEYQYLYGVPVEVRHPYVITTDIAYQIGVTYYTYNALTNRFDVDTAYSAGDPIPSSSTDKTRFVADSTVVTA